MQLFKINEIEKRFKISARKLSFLVRKGYLNPVAQNNILYVAEDEILRYLNLPPRIRKNHHRSYLKTLGPGLITGASDDDPSGIGTYSMAGSAYGLSFAWLSVYLLPMMTAVQETVARIGIVTGKGLSGAIGKSYGKKTLYPLVFLLVFANTINIGADIGAMAAALRLVVPINFYVAAIVLTLFMLFLEIFFKYHSYSKILKFLTLSLFAYILTGFIIKPDWVMVLKSLAIPTIKFDMAFFALLVAVMGTTITPYLFFWQASEEIEEEKERGGVVGNAEHHKIAVTREIKEMRKDTLTGMSLSNLVFLFIIITTAFVLHNNGITNIETAEEAALALAPLAGEGAALLFSIGIIGVGLLAVPVLAGASAYGVAELLKWKEGLNKRYSQARGFYGVIIISMLLGLLMNFIGINPIKALYYAAIVNGLVAPMIMYYIFKLGRDKKVMGSFTNPGWVNFWGFIATFIMGISAVLLIIFWVMGY